MSIDPERLNAFQTRMNEWVSGQGLLFQLSHGGTVQGGKSAFFAGMMRLVVRGILLLMVLGVVGWILMAKRVQFGWFRDQLGEGISTVLGADSAEVGGVGRERGQLTIAKIVLEGGEESFFYNAEMSGVRTTMGLTDGMLTPWDGGRVWIKELHTKVKSGADTDEAAAKAFQSIFRGSDRFQFRVVDVEDATVTWGYSAMHRGSIRDSHLVATKTDDGGWNMVFTGGRLSQNWLRRLEIERIEVLVTPDGVVFEDVRLKQESGTVQMRVEFMTGGSRPTMKGAGSFNGVPIGNLIAPEYREFIGGEFSGSFTLDGSTNSQEGFGMTVKVKLEEGDRIELRDRFSMFRAISAADRFRSYKKVRFDTGQFDFQTGGGLMKVSDIWLSAQDLMRLEGGFLVRPPTNEEVAALLKVGARATVGGLPLGRRPGDEDAGDELSLKRAGAAKKKDDKNGIRPSIILGKEFGGGETRLLEEDALQREQSAPILEGRVRLGLIREVFDRSPALERLYPVDPDEGVRWLELPLNGNIYSVGVKQAKDLLLQVQEGR
jgi:hypothetical protein